MPNSLGDGLSNYSEFVFPPRFTSGASFPSRQRGALFFVHAKNNKKQYIYLYIYIFIYIDFDYTVIFRIHTLCGCSLSFFLSFLGSGVRGIVSQGGRRQSYRCSLGPSWLLMTIVDGFLGRTELSSTTDYRDVVSLQNGPFPGVCFFLHFVLIQWSKLPSKVVNLP